MIVGSYGAAGCSGSSKEYTTKNKGLNEDRYIIKQACVMGDPTGLVVGVFDGHGGIGASSFAADRILDVVENSLPDSCESCDNDQLNNKIAHAMQSGFSGIDRELFLKIKSLREEYEHLKPTHCKCNFFREIPCRCLKAPRSAHEGSTGTVVVIANRKIICANIGDSDAILFAKSGCISHTFSTDHSMVSSQDSLQSTSSDTTQPSEPSDPYNDESKLEPEPIAQVEIKTLNKTELEPEPEPETQTQYRCIATRADTLPRKRRKFTVNMLTIADTPIPNPKNEDYERLKSIALERKNLMVNQHLAYRFRNNGIRLGKNSRCNYVTFDGAHSLNMTRAFGNFGHKVYTDDDVALLDEKSSPIIVRPHVNVYEPQLNNDFLFCVVGSDGLWDNVPKERVALVVSEYCRGRIRCQEEEQATGVSKVLLTKIAEGAAERLLSLAVRQNNKLDDITLVVIIFDGVLTPDCFQN